MRALTILLLLCSPTLGGAAELFEGRWLIENTSGIIIFGEGRWSISLDGNIIDQGFYRADGDLLLSTSVDGTSEEIKYEVSSERLILRSSDGTVNLRRLTPVADGEQKSSSTPRDNNVGSALTDGTPVSNEWLNHLAGRRYTQLGSYSGGDAGGSSWKAVMDLCADGRFYFWSTSSVSVYGDLGGTGSAGGTKSRRGGGRLPPKMKPPG